MPVCNECEPRAVSGENYHRYPTSDSLGSRYGDSHGTAPVHNGIRGGVARTFKGLFAPGHPAGVLTQYEGGFPYEYALLLAALLSLDALGGDKSVGLGRCKIRLKEGTLCWNSERISSDDIFQSFKDESNEWGLMLEMLREEPIE